MPVEAIQTLRDEIESTEFQGVTRREQKILIEEWSEMAISAFSVHPPEQWRVVCVGEALSAVLAGLHSLALRALVDATLPSDEVDIDFIEGISTMEREVYALPELQKYLQFVKTIPAQPHPVFSFRKSGHLPAREESAKPEESSPEGRMAGHQLFLQALARALRAKHPAIIDHAHQSLELAAANAPGESKKALLIALNLAAEN